MRAKLRSPAGQAAYARRKAVVEPVFGVLKQQRGMRQFRTRGLQNVNNEFTLATLAYQHHPAAPHAGSLKTTPATTGGKKLKTRPPNPPMTVERYSKQDRRCSGPTALSRRHFSP